MSGVSVIFFYICVFFAGYYGSNVLNMLTVRPLITNRYIAALFPVYGFAMGHAYMISTKPLPAGKDVTMESALLEFVVLPLVVVTMGAFYFMWNSKDKESQEELVDNTERAAETDDDAVTEEAVVKSKQTQKAATDEATGLSAEKKETKS